MKFGLDKVIHDLLAVTHERLTYTAELVALGDTPIERLLFQAIYLQMEFDNAPFANIRVHLKGDAGEAPTLQEMLDWKEQQTLIVAPQYQFESWRVDFLLFYRRQDGALRRLIVECDGHEFHERTPEQAQRDRSRDRAAQLAGIPVLRFTGREIWRDALACAQQINEWCREERFRGEQEFDR